MKRTWILRWLPSAALLLLASPFRRLHAAEDTIKVGILHSLSGTMAISESALKDTVLMLIADQNRKGGLLGRKLEPVVVDPASDWDIFTDKALELLTKEKVAVVFGCWTSTSRKAVIADVRAIERPAFLSRCNTKAKKARATCSTPAPRPTSRQFRPSAT